MGWREGDTEVQCWCDIRATEEAARQNNQEATNIRDHGQGRRGLVEDQAGEAYSVMKNKKGGKRKKRGSDKSNWIVGVVGAAGAKQSSDEAQETRNNKAIQQKKNIIFKMSSQTRDSRQ